MQNATKSSLSSLLRALATKHSPTSWTSPHALASVAWSSSSAVEQTSTSPISIPVPQQQHAQEQQTAQATLRGARISHRKLNDFLGVIRGQHIDDALIQCQIHTKKAARMTGKLLESARANAVHNHGLDASRLVVDQAWVGKGQCLRRVSIHGRGRSGVMHKNRAHMTVVVKEEADEGRTKRVKVIPPVWERERSL